MRQSRVLGGLLLFVISGLHSAAAQPINYVQLDLYSGTIGGHPVEARLGFSNGVLVGDYFYGSKPNPHEELRLHGVMDSSGSWDIQEQDQKMATPLPDPIASGHWKLQKTDKGWKGTWSKPNGSENIPIEISLTKTNTGYGRITLTPIQPAPGKAGSCTLNIYRRQKLWQTIDISIQDDAGNAADECEESSVGFPDLNFDGYADLIFPSDNPLHNVTYSLWLYQPKNEEFVSAGELTEPTVDPIHKNIVVSTHYSAASHGVQIFRFLPGQSEPTLIAEKKPCEESAPEQQHRNSCAGSEDYEYDFKTGKIVESTE